MAEGCVLMQKFLTCLFIHYDEGGGFIDYFVKINLINGGINGRAEKLQSQMNRLGFLYYKNNC